MLSSLSSKNPTATIITNTSFVSTEEAIGIPQTIGNLDPFRLLLSFLMLTCEGYSVTELKIVGDKIVRPSKVEGYSVQDHTLSPGFSVDSFVTTLMRLTGLKVVILVPLRIWVLSLIRFIGCTA